jgi:hypothetical protein
MSKNKQRRSFSRDRDADIKFLRDFISQFMLAPIKEPPSLKKLRQKHPSILSAYPKTQEHVDTNLFVNKDIIWTRNQPHIGFVHTPETDETTILPIEMRSHIAVLTTAQLRNNMNNVIGKNIAPLLLLLRNILKRDHTTHNYLPDRHSALQDIMVDFPKFIDCSGYTDHELKELGKATLEMTPLGCPHAMKFGTTASTWNDFLLSTLYNILHPDLYIALQTTRYLASNFFEAAILLCGAGKNEQIRKGILAKEIALHQTDSESNFHIRQRMALVLTAAQTLKNEVQITFDLFPKILTTIMKNGGLTHTPTAGQILLGLIAARTDGVFGRKYTYVTSTGATSQAVARCVGADIAFKIFAGPLHPKAEGILKQRQRILPTFFADIHAQRPGTNPDLDDIRDAVSATFHMRVMSKCPDGIMKAFLQTHQGHAFIKLLENAEGADPNAKKRVANIIGPHRRPINAPPQFRTCQS